LILRIYLKAVIAFRATADAVAIPILHRNRVLFNGILPLALPEIQRKDAKKKNSLRMMIDLNVPSF